MNPKAKVDAESIELAKARGIDLLHGYIRNTDHRFICRDLLGLYPGAHKGGLALRSRVVWWLHTGEAIVGGELDIHHKNEDRADDHFGNLEKLDHLIHARQHNPKSRVEVLRKCKGCGKEFLIAQWRLKDETRGQFCGQDCYHSVPRTAMHAAAISNGLRKSYREGRR